MNIKQVARYAFLSLTLFTTLVSAGTKEPVDYVDMFIGTSNSRWMLGPYAQEPFGMVQLGPDNQGNVWMGGYEYAINSVSGFSHLHAWTMGGLMIMPTTADLALSNPVEPFGGFPLQGCECRLPFPYPERDGKSLTGILFRLSVRP